MYICSENSQRGGVLLEALIGVFLTCTIGAGTLHITSRIVKGMHELRAEGMALVQMRQLLADSGADLCGGSAASLELPDGTEVDLETVECSDELPTFTITPDVNDPDAPASVTVDGIRQVRLSISLENLGVAMGTARDTMDVGTQQ